MNEQIIELDSMTKAAILGHARASMPREACGLVIVRKGKLQYAACRNIAPARKPGEPEQFDIHPEDYARAEDIGEVLAVVHSHVGVPATPTQPDLVACEKSPEKLPWIIVNPQTEQWVQFKPSGYEAPLYGRVWRHAILDCYTFCQDYYRQALGLHLRDYPREHLWWHKKDADGKPYDLYMENFAKEGFVPVPIDKLQIHDAMLMRVGSGVEVVNHAAVMVGDNIMGHHFMHRLSSKDVYGGWWRKVTVQCVRHESLL